MKDDEIRGEFRVLRGQIQALSEIVHDLRFRVDKTGNLTVQHCDTCAHETMQIAREDYGLGPPESYVGPYMPASGHSSVSYFVCLGCGSKFRLFPTSRSEPYVPSCDCKGGQHGKSTRNPNMRP